MRRSRALDWRGMKTEEIASLLERTRGEERTKDGAREGGREGRRGGRREGGKEGRTLAPSTAFSSLSFRTTSRARVRRRSLWGLRVSDGRRRSSMSMMACLARNGREGGREG